MRKTQTLLPVGRGSWPRGFDLGVRYHCVIRGRGLWPTGLCPGVMSYNHLLWLTFTHTSTIYLAGSGNFATGTYLTSGLTATTYHLLFAINVFISSPNSSIKDSRWTVCI